MQTSANRAALSGIVGAASLNIIHESARKLMPDAPHVHSVAMRAMQKFVLDPLDVTLSKQELYLLTLAGDLVSNSLYYAAVVGASPEKSSQGSVWARAAGFGLAAGALTVVLPPAAGLGQQPSRNFAKTAGLTVAWYVLGALAAAAVYNSGKSLAR